MLTIYVITAIVGGGLILLSALGGLGHGDFDVSHDVDVDVNTDFDHNFGADHSVTDAASDFWLPFLSLRFWTYGLGCFGIFGSFLTFTGLAKEPLAAMVAGGVGFVGGTAAAWIMRWASKNETDSSVGERDLMGVAGKVLVRAGEGNPAKIRVEVKGDIIDLLAKSHDGSPIEKDEDVVVVGIEGNQAIIAKSNDFLNS
ncbi:NfeD family protein [Kamptonema cortianum]|nr:NfeD family protein [Geitlerinema splendidum]MDK3158609.1 NfeD family protein [Kamptonema cortianum]